MTFKDIFGADKPIIGMIHTNRCESISMLELAKQEIEIYLNNGVVPLIENYFGSADDCRQVLQWIQREHPGSVYGINILGDYPLAFSLAAEYGAKFIQIDSVCGHLTPGMDEEYAESLRYYRRHSDAIVLGGVRFKYQAVKSGRTTAEDLLLGMKRCDAIVCTGTGTGQNTPFEKIEEFKSVVKDFPIIVGAGVTIETAEETFRKSDGAIIGSWFKYKHDACNTVNPDYVKSIAKVINPSHNKVFFSYKSLFKPCRCFVERKDIQTPEFFGRLQFIETGARGFFPDVGNRDVIADLWREELGGRYVTLILDDYLLRHTSSGKGELYLMTWERGSNIEDYVNLGTLEMVSSGIKYKGSFHSNGNDVMVLGISADQIKDYIEVPADPFSREHFKKLCVSQLGGSIVFNFAVCGEFDLSIYFHESDSSGLRRIFSKSFCCK